MGADFTGTTGPGPRPGISGPAGPSWPRQAAAISTGDTVASPRSFDVARLAAGAVADAVARVVAGEDRRAFCLIRPPGHHALADRAMGFCLLNNVAVGARLASTELDLARVMIVDWDVHHGNGTQAIFWEEPRVGFLVDSSLALLSGHRPGDETGGGAALGTKVNLPIEFGTSRKQYFDRFAARFGAAGRQDPAGAGAGQCRLRRPSRRSDRLAGAGNRGFPAADPDGPRRGRQSTPGAGSSAFWKGATT